MFYFHAKYLDILQRSSHVHCYLLLTVKSLFIKELVSTSHGFLITIETPAGIYLLKVSNRNTRARCEICSKLTIKTPERCRLGFQLLLENPNEVNPFNIYLELHRQVSCKNKEIDA